MATLYIIKDWNDYYENNRTRDLKRMLWVPIPTSLDGDGYTELLDHKNGTAHYGIWVGCVIVASGCDPRGTLLRGTKKPFCASSLSRVLRMPEPLITEALKRFVSIGWMDTQVYDVQDTCDNPAGASHLPATIPHLPALSGMEGMEGRNGREGKEGSGGIELPAALDGPGFREAWSDWKNYRRKKRKPVTEIAEREQLKDLARYGHEIAIEAIRTSIRSDWQGLFPEKIKNATRPTHAAGPGQQYDPNATLEGFR